MKTQLIPITSPEAISTAQTILEEGGLVAFPTDTVYGVGAQVFNVKAVESIYSVKERPVEKAIPVLVADWKDLDLVAVDIPEIAARLAAEFWPGALTLVIPRRPDLPSIVSAGPTVGVRVPDSAFTRRLLQATGPLAVTSANRSEQANPLDASQVLAQLGGRIPLLLDGGRVPGGLPSSVVDCTGPTPRLLRQGPIPLEAILAALEATKKF
jgi:L-threonylcarbamoyladenylate synthase